MDVTRKLAAPAVPISTYAEVFGISRNHAYRMVRAGEVRSFRVGKKILIPTQQLRDLLLIENLPIA